ncbi:TadE/TadG family type IV pilus assembly protein [Bradyrhizobium septentrionale]|uniref:Pilus assembly protein n=1 Tax=Bradyrhizobium septentrionale TaxID=1404411 RepID=A0A973VXP0_9BRAD|nr:TadE/TadG family type IV pilus assembly protein [Bradyrhizobium septentrionale]UGY12652.1 pilus assembly protein [Bradyrhizobium septentrionale]UGY21197.1 pilus assembly protein [Bradyrhizobium septentrionale]
MTCLSFRLRQFRIDTNAVAAIEFAMILPFMLLLYVGGIELANGMAINVKVTAAAHSVADMVSQNTQVSATQLQNILGASTAILAPYPTTINGNSLATVTVSGVSTDSNGNATVQWSASYNGTSYGTGRSIGQRITLPSSLAGTQNYNVSFVLGEVSYGYTPHLGFTISGTLTLADSYYLFPRCSTNSPANANFPYYDVKLTSSTTCTCIQHLQQKSC